MVEQPIPGHNRAFDEPIWSDSHLNEVLCFRGGVICRLTDWQETKWTFVFKGVRGIEIFGIGNELESTVVEDGTPFKDRVRSVQVMEDVTSCKCFLFYPAWSTEYKGHLLQIVAREAELVKGWPPSSELIVT